METELPTVIKVYTVFFKSGLNPVLVRTIENLTATHDDQIVFTGDYSDGTWKLSTDFSSPVKKSAQEMQVPEPVYSEQKEWDLVRKKRNFLLTDSDWIIVKYTEQNQPIPEAWVTYRQDLRDITAQPLTSSFVWPTKPTTS
jgi:hypothetical protein